MKHFFIVLFGGVGAIFLGISISFLSGIIINKITLYNPSLKNQSLLGLVSSVVSKPVEGTSISGLKRLIRYSASEEESLMIAATLSLSHNSNQEISAKGYLIQNLRDNKIVAEYNKDKLLPIASLTKLVTAIVAKKVIKDNAKIKITKEITSVYGNTAQFRTGQTFEARDLYYPLLMVSSNDAAEALARSYGRKRFIEAMNEFAQSIGAYRTIFVDPSGLSKDNLSTADDLVTIYSWIMNNYPEIIEITKLKSKTVRIHTWINPAHFLSWSNYGGGKNGYTEEAQQTSVSVFYMGQERVPYITVLLGSKSRDSDIVKLLGKVKS